MNEDTVPVARANGGPRPTELGPYRVYERLGVGGLACVYRAQRIDDPDACDVALKRLHPHLADEPAAVASFVQEVRVAHLLDHPVIRRVFALRREDGELLMPMEYIDGRSLHVLLKRAARARRRLPVPGVLAVLHRLCAGLHYAHELMDENGNHAGFVHRDISQSNVIISKSGQLKLIDMGVARARIGDLATSSGLIKGKLGYMAPEVLAHRSFDRRADIFSVGVVAWELLTQRKLFPVHDPTVDVTRVRDLPVDAPSTRNPSCPPELDAVVLQALARDPDERWQSCAEMVAAFEEVGEKLGEPLSEGAAIDLADISDDTTVITLPERPSERRRFARGTTAESAIPSAPTPVTPPAPVEARSCFRCRRSLFLGLAIGCLTSILIYVAATGESQPTDAPAWAAHAPWGADAGPAIDVAPPARPSPDAGTGNTVRASEVERIDGPWPRSRSASFRYRARLCIDEAGKVTSATLIDGPQRLETRIVRALLRWRYLPYTRGGRPRPVCFEIESRVHKIRRRGDRD